MINIKKSKMLLNPLAEASWKINSGISFSFKNNDEDLYQKWAKKRREHFKKWGNLPTTKSENKKLLTLKNKYRGKRIFILGSGPSLNDTALEKLENEYTFGVNRIYLLYDRIKWRPNFYTVNDWEVGPDNAKEIRQLKDTHFFCPTRFRGLFSMTENTYMYRSCHETDIGAAFSYDLTEGAVMGGTVLTLVIQIAYYMGFDPIYLIGVDVNYTVPESVKQTGKRFSNGNLQFLESTEKDINHFDPRYFGKGKRWHNPNTDKMIEGFDKCREAIERRGRYIFNATVGGKLEVIKRVNFDQLFEKNYLFEPKEEVSIIMPAYNEEEHIKDAIQSVIDQSYERWVLIVIDDGSTDCTAEIVQKFDDIRIYYYRQKNRGRAAARNFGLEKATSKYIAFLDADDIFIYDKLEKQVKLMKKIPNITGVMGGWKRINSKGQELKIKKTNNGLIIPKEKYLGGCPVHLCMSLMHRDFIDKGIRFEQNRKYGEDWEFFLRLSNVYDAKFMTHQDIVGCYRATLRAEKKTTENYARAHISVVDNAFNSYLKYRSDDDQYRAARFEVTTRMAARFFGSRQADLGNKYLIEANLYRPGEEKKYLDRTAVHLVSWIEHFSEDNIGWLIKNLDKELIEKICLAQLPGVILYKWYGKQKRNDGSAYRRLLSAITLIKHSGLLIGTIMENAKKGNNPPEELSKFGKKIWKTIGLVALDKKK